VAILSWWPNPLEFQANPAAPTTGPDLGAHERLVDSLRIGEKPSDLLSDVRVLEKFEAGSNERGAPLAGGGGLEEGRGIVGLFLSLRRPRGPSPRG
jgi:hypothetical protein